MNTLPKVAYFGNDWFADNRTSSHHVARQLAQRTSVSYFECPGLRPPAGTGRDVKKLFTKLARGLSPAITTPEGLRVKTLLQWPAHGSAMFGHVNRIWAGTTVRLALGAQQPLPVAWCTVPHVSGFISGVKTSALVYHCIDDYAALPGVDATAVRAMDDRLARAADLLIIASRQVYEARRHLNPNTVLMPHGVDYEHFSRARDATLPIPAEVANLKGPVVGFFGLIERWIDIDLVGWLAERMPDVTFVMIGRVATTEALPKAKNILWLGPRPYEMLPAYGRRFDAAIIPYRDTAQVRASNPLKLREYLAMGVPIVSVSAPEIERFAEVLRIARTQEDFLTELKAALAGGIAAPITARGMAAAREADWGAWTNTALGHLAAVLNKKNGT